MRSRVFNAILYMESTSYDTESILSRVSQNAFNFSEWYYILHDKDVADDGKSIKKPHYHLVFRYDDARELAVVARDLGIPENDLEVIGKSKKGCGRKTTFRGGVRYLLHFDNPDKFQYSLTEIIGSDNPAKYFGGDETASVFLLADAIFSGQCTSASSLFHYAMQNNCYAAFRRNFAILTKLQHEYMENNRQSVYHDRVAFEAQERVLNRNGIYTLVDQHVEGEPF